MMFAAELAWAKRELPPCEGFFFDDDTFNIQKARTIELCEKLKPLASPGAAPPASTTDYDTLQGHARGRLPSAYRLASSPAIRRF